MSSELTRLKESHARMCEQVRDARKVIMLYRRWEHAEEAECAAETGDMPDLTSMLTEASFAAQDFVEKWENTIHAGL